MLFSGDTTANGDFVWVQDTGNVAAVWDTIQGDYFSFAIDSVGWTNVDQIAGNAPFTTGVSVDLPPGHDGGNSKVFMYFSNINSVVSIDDWGLTGTFSMGSSYQLSIGEVIRD